MHSAPEPKSGVSTNSTTLVKLYVEEAVGFEPTDRFQPADFKSAAIDHSATLPLVREVRFELTRPNGQKILSLLRLPISSLAVNHTSYFGIA